MKNIIKSIFPLLSLACLSGCDFLEFDETSGTNSRDNVYNYFANIKSVLNNVYSYMPQDMGTVGGAKRDCGSDDAEFANTGANVQMFNNGSWSSVNTIDTEWSLYEGIRAATDFIEMMKTVDLSRFEHTPAYQNQMAQMKYYPFQARVLRAYYFFELAKRYGDIPMPLKVLTPEEANSIPKTPFEDVISFISGECLDCSRELPEHYRTAQLGNETGRVTKGFALAVRSKALLYAASRLHNPSMDKDRWKASALAAQDIMDLGIYTLEGAGKAINNVTSKEMVLARMSEASSAFEKDNFPIRFTFGKRQGDLATATFPTQNLVDAFQTLNGYDVVLTESGWHSDDPEFDPSRPYENRDPRLALTVLADGMSFKKDEIQLWKGGADDQVRTMGGSPTGYFMRKYLRENTSFEEGKPVSDKHSWVIYRYAETLLTYAESMVEAFDNPDYKDSEYRMSAREALNHVRSNAGMPAVTDTDKDVFIDKLRNEWRVEFAFEDHRFWDIRRWCIGNDTQKKIYGVSIVKTDNGKEYSRFLLEERYWNDKMNLYPIRKAEMFKNANLAPQNPGWE